MAKPKPYVIHFRAILQRAVPASILARSFAPPYARPSLVAWAVAGIVQNSHDGLPLFPKESRNVAI